MFGEGDTVPQIQLIQPAAPAPLLGEVLALTAARVFTLSAGEAFEDGLPEGNREIAACLRGAVTVGFPEGEAVLSAGGLALLTASKLFRHGLLSTRANSSTVFPPSTGRTFQASTT